LPIPVASPTSRRLIPIAYVRRSTSRIFLIDTLSAGIGHLLVARKTDQLIRLSTGAISRPLSACVEFGDRLPDNGIPAPRRDERSPAFKNALTPGAAAAATSVRPEAEYRLNEIAEAPPSRLERVGLIAERVARLRLARAREESAP
jgi:hypothetical protein